LKGAASGVKSYNSRSGRILGILDEMKDEFSRDIGNAQKADYLAEVAFQKLRAAKLAEIAAATEQKEMKEAQLADSLYKMTKAQENKASVENAMDADQKFLAEVEKLQKEATDEYNGRVEVRSAEIQTLGEALKILTADAARENFGKTMNFLQVGSMSLSATQRAAAQDRASTRAMQRIAKVARQHRNWAMAALAVRVRLDAFTKVKAAMDKMLAELKKQQSEEYEKWEFCKKSIDENEDSIKVAENEKEDLDNKHTELTNTIATIKANIEMLKKEVADMEVSLKQAGEERHDENELYQTSVMDQRATINILNKVVTRLDAYYKKDAVLLQSSAKYDPTYNPPPPPKPAPFRRNAKAGGVLQLLHEIVTDAEKVEKELQMTENYAQEEYAAFVKASTESIEADRASIKEKEGQVASNSAELSETNEAILANDAGIAELNEVLKAHHMDCDYLLKYFDVRQKARAEEMDAIEDAKAILSGANFGR
jgi:chromosome segregation ATPase